MKSGNKIYKFKILERKLYTMWINIEGKNFSLEIPSDYGNNDKTL